MDTPEPDAHRSPGPGGRGWGWVAPLAVITGLGVAAIAAGFQAFDAECRDLPREDLSLAEMGQVRRLVDRYKSDPSTRLALSGRQASFLLREEFDLPVWMEVRDAELALEVRIPQAGRCWNVSYRGDLVVRESVATIRPRELVIGHLPLTPLVRGVAWDVHPAQLALPRAIELLEHTTHTSLAPDGVEVQVDDPGWLR